MEVATDTYQLLGLMSGSSLDGLDIAHCRFILDAQKRIQSWELTKATTIPFTEEWKATLLSLPEYSAKSLLSAHAAFGQYLGQIARDFLDAHQLSVQAIASHGHTIFHFPNQNFTFQLGDGAQIAALTGCTTISDFRAMDIAQGGQGAPVAPIADHLLLPGYDFYLNLGGIANISAPLIDRIVAFDISGANQVLNALSQIEGLAYDDGGKLAASGQLLPTLYEQANQLAFFKDDYPKSLGNDWVQERQLKLYLEYDASISDRLHTACHQIAFQIANSIQQIIRKEQLHQKKYNMIVSGGGAWNRFLIASIKEACKPFTSLEIVIPKEEIINYKEAILMALMGVLRLTKQPNCYASVTGAQKDSIGGAIHFISQ